MEDLGEEKILVVKGKIKIIKDIITVVFYFYFSGLTKNLQTLKHEEEDIFY